MAEGLQVSMHVCGGWVRAMLVGWLDWSELPEVVQIAQRVQINTHGEALVSTSRVVQSLLDGMMLLRDSKRPREYIFQYDGVNNHLPWAVAGMTKGMPVSALFDLSAGAGELPEAWPAVNVGAVRFGYAGGLGPENVVEQIQKIEAVNEAKTRWEPTPANYGYWIDMERRVRTEDDSALDLDKVRKVLELCEPFVG
jgi:hypothetical protein